jgi:hypothetical protein
VLASQVARPASQGSSPRAPQNQRQEHAGAIREAAKEAAKEKREAGEEAKDAVGNIPRLVHCAIAIGKVFLDAKKTAKGHKKTKDGRDRKARPAAKAKGDGTTALAAGR